MAIVILSKIEASNLSLKDYLSMSSETPVELIYPTGEYREESLFFPPFQTNQKMLDESLPRVEKAIHSQGQNDYEKLKLGFEDLKTTCKILAANLHASDKKLEAVTIENMVRAVRLEELQRDNKQLQDERVKLEELVRDNRQLQDEPELLKTLKRENQQLRDDLRNSNTLDGENQRLRKERITLLNAVSLLKASVSLLKASNLTARTEGELALIKEKQTLQDEVVSLRDAPNCANHCCVMTGEVSDVRARLDAEVEDLKAQLRSSAENFENSRRQLAHENVALQENLKESAVREELEWTANFNRLQRFKANTRDHKGVMHDAGLVDWVIRQRQQLRAYEGSKRRKIDLLNSIHFQWGDCPSDCSDVME